MKYINKLIFSNINLLAKYRFCLNIFKIIPFFISGVLYFMIRVISGWIFGTQKTQKTQIFTNKARVSGVRRKALGVRFFAKGLSRNKHYNNVDCFVLNEAERIHVIVSEEKQSRVLGFTGLLRRFTPRNDGNRPFLNTPFSLLGNRFILFSFLGILVHAVPLWIMWS
jgi:hypothetical protein